MVGMNDETKPIAAEQEQPETPAAKPAKKPKKPKKPKKALHEFEEIDDMRYRGPLSYFGLRALGWGALVIACIGILLMIAMKFGVIPSNPGLENLSTILRGFVSAMMPLFLLANYSLILREQYKFKKNLLTFGALTLVFAGVFYFIVEHYVITLLVTMAGLTRAEALAIIGQLGELFPGGYITLNIFLDLFLCTLFAYFVNYQPKRFFQGEKIYIFRAFAALPLLYEVASIAIKGLHGFGVLTISPYLYPWLTCKPPVTFLVFVLIILFLKKRERIFVLGGRSLEEYEHFLGTNTNSWHVSLVIFWLMLGGGLIDGVLNILLVLIISISQYVPDQVEVIGAALTKMGIGGGVVLFFVAPIALLFSYTREPKKKDLVGKLPFIGIGLVAIAFIEGIFIILTHLPE